MKTKTKKKLAKPLTKKRAASLKRIAKALGKKKYGEPNWGKRWTGAPAPHLVARAAAEAEMACSYVAVVLQADDERTRSTYATADAAFAHAQEKIESLSRTQGQRLTFAICKVIEIVEPVTPSVARRAPKRSDGSPAIEAMFGKWVAPLDFRSASIDNLVLAYGGKTKQQTIDRINRNK